MKRRYFLALGLFSTVLLSKTDIDYRKYRSKIWSISSLDNTAIALYGREKFSTLKKSNDIDLIVPKGNVIDRENIPISISSTIEAKSVAIFQDKNEKSLIAVFHLLDKSIISYDIVIRMEFKGTIFAVIEGIDGKLYYTRKYIDIITLSCMI